MKNILEIVVCYALKKINEVDIVALRIQFENILKILSAFSAYSAEDAIKAILMEVEDA